MTLPYENATSGKRALEDIQSILKKFGCGKFAAGEDFDTGEIFVQFEHHGRRVHLKASARGYAVAWLKAHPLRPQMKKTKAQHEARAFELGAIAVYSILRDWIKGQITAVEIGMLSFESAFLSHLMLPNGQRVIERVEEMRLLPAPGEERSNG